MTASPLIKFTSKDEFVAALEARRPFLKEWDKKNATEHKAAEVEYLRNFREDCKAAAKWTYEELREQKFKLPRSNRYGDYPLPPDCPIRQEPRLDELLKSLELTSQKEFTVDSGNSWSSAHYILTFDPEIEAAKKVC